MSLKTIYIYTDKFQPPHLGKKIIWTALCKRYGKDNCFIAADGETKPLTFEEKQSIFASMGIDSGNVIKSEKMFSQIRLPAKFNPAEASVVWVTPKELVPSIPVNITPYRSIVEAGKSYYMTIPTISVNVEGSNLTDKQVIDFLGKVPMTKELNMDSFKKMFGFFDEYMYKTLTDKFKQKTQVNESPDFPKVSGVSFTDYDAITFTLFNRFVVLSEFGDYHCHLAQVLRTFKDKVEQKKIDLSKDEYVDTDVESGQIRIQGDLENAYEISKLKETNEMNCRSMGIVTGRIWTKKKIISIWKESYANLDKNGFKKLEEFISQYGDPKEYTYDDASRGLKMNPPMTFDKVASITSDSPVDNKKDADKFKDIKHVMDPVLKNILKKFDKNTPYNKKAELADKLHMSVAKLNSLIGLDETTISESPDFPNILPRTGPNSYDAVAFMIFDHFDVIGLHSSVYHGDLAEELINFSKLVGSNEVDLTKKEWSDKHGLIKITGDLSKADQQIEDDIADKGVDDAREWGILTGRLWKDKKVVSIWKESYNELNISTFNKLEKFISQFGNPKEFVYDDAGDKGDRAVTYDKVSSIVSNTKPSSDDIVTPADVELVRQLKSSGTNKPLKKGKFADIKHVMDPVLKNILKTFDKDTPYNKKAELADKLHMSVAKLNSLLSIEENT